MTIISVLQMPTYSDNIHFDSHRQADSRERGYVVAEDIVVRGVSAIGDASLEPESSTPEESERPYARK